ncbi:MAG: transcriptional regulator [Kordiimonadales bacterium]|nr:MAG: transcriptional regulator [Kordiimonadales bacterium]
MSQPQIQDVFSALGDPTRFAIVESLLRDKELTIGQLAEPHAMSAPAISRHVKVLEEAGLIERKIEKQWRVVRLRQDCFASIEDWLKRYRDFWNASFDRLEVFLEEEQKNAGDTK